MAAMENVDIDAKVKASLAGTRFESVDIERLSGGSVNHTYVARLAKQLDDGAVGVMIKHGEPFMMTRPDTALSLARCVWIQYPPCGSLAP